MNTITIRQASAVYPVHVGRDLLDGVGSLVRAKGRVFVISACMCLRKDQVPNRFEFKQKYYGDVGEWVNVGDSAIVGANNYLSAGMKLWPGVTLPDKAISF